MELSPSTKRSLSPLLFASLNPSSSSSVLCLNLGQFTFTDLVHHGSQPAVKEEEEEEGDGEEIFEDAPVSSFSLSSTRIDADEPL